MEIDLEKSKEITAIIDSSIIHENVKFFKNKAKIDIMPVLKSNAYGHGLYGISKICRDIGIEIIGVATLYEALLLRKSGDTGCILAWLYSIDNPYLKHAIINNIDIALFDEKHIDFLIKLIPSGKKCNIHLFVDTGFNRSGIPQNRIIHVAKELSKNKKINIVGLMSHLIESEKKNDKYVKQQIELFKNIKYYLSNYNIFPKYIHIANTNALLNYNIMDCNIARIGIGIYGLSHNKNLKLSMKLISKIIQIKNISKGSSIGYDRTYITTKNLKICIIPIGYGDILPLSASNKMYVWVNGTKRRVLGLENMDQIVTESKSKDKEGDEVIIFDNFKTLCKLAKFGKLSPIELLMHMSSRINYQYI